MPETVLNKQTFLYRFLMEPTYSSSRHILFMLVIGVISFNQTTFVFRQNTELLGSYLYWATALIICTYLMVGYFHLYYLVPRLLLKKKYVWYLAASSLSVVFLLWIRSAEEYAIYYWLDLPPLRQTYWNSIALLDNLSDFMINMICMTGASMTILLRHWLQESQRMNEMEQHQVKTEVEQLKEQISPPLLFHILKYTSQLVKENPGKTSGILFQLSELLRYQLYDCNREKVLLTSEIRFLNNYLQLEQSASGKPAWKVTSAGITGQAQVSPLLFLSFVQSMVRAIKKNPAEATIYIHFDAEPEKVLFTCATDIRITFQEQELFRIRRRLDLLYPEKYRLTVSPEAATTGSKITLELITL